MKRKIALLPVDARPVTRDLPGQIARMAGWEVVTPERDDLGFLKKPGNIVSIIEWVRRVANEVDGFVISSDMLGYGGLVPSRISIDALQDIKERLQLLKELKRTYLEKPLMVFSATMRISNSYVNEEEKDYWEHYGEEIFAYSYHTHSYEKTGNEDSFRIMNEMQEKIPDEVLSDYLATRLRNYEMNNYLLQLAEEEFLDVLVFPQDDTSQYGLNVKEQEGLASDVLRKKLFSKVFIYPGADEVANTLIARMIYDLENVKRPVFYPFYSGEKGAHISAMYEDRPIAESVKGQIFAFGSHTVATPQEADILLAVNVPGRQQGDLALQTHLNGVDTSDRSIGEWIYRMHDYIHRGCRVAVADLAYANGADPAMIPQLLEGIDIDKLYGFAAWNTAGNTLGTVIAQAAMLYLQDALGTLSTSERDLRKNEQLLLRFLEDYVYQTVVRQEVRKAIDEPSFSPDELLGLVSAAFIKEYEKFLKEEGSAWLQHYRAELVNLNLPWHRTFEIGFGTSLKEKKASTPS